MVTRASSLFFILIFLFSSVSYAQEERASMTETSQRALIGFNTLLERVESGEITYFDIPTFSAFEKICQSEMSLDVNYQEMCQVVVQSELCQEIPEESRVDCNASHQVKDLSIWDFFQGCGSGMLNSVKDFFVLIKELVNWAWEAFKSEEVRSEAYATGKSYVEAAELFLAVEYDRGLSEASKDGYECSEDWSISPKANWNCLVAHRKAAEFVTGSLGALLYQNIVSAIESNFQEFGCLNWKARNEAICASITGLAGGAGGGAALKAILKKGPSAAQALNGFAESVSDLQKRYRRNVQKVYQENPGLRTSGIDLGRLFRKSSKSRTFELPKDATPFGDKVRLTPPLNPPDIKIGQEVLWPRSGKRSGYSLGEIVHVGNDGRALVTTKGPGGESIRKSVRLDEFREPFQPEQLVSVPTSKGGFNNARITAVDAETNTVRLEFSKDGDLFWENVKAENIREPFTVDTTVRVPDAKTGKGVEGTIAYIDEELGKASVALKETTTNGLPKQRYIDLDRLGAPTGQAKKSRGPSGSSDLRAGRSSPEEHESAPIVSSASSMERSLQALRKKHGEVWSKREARTNGYENTIETATGKKVNLFQAGEDVEFARRQGRLFENISPADLEDGKYTYVLTKDGKWVFGRIDNSAEFGVKHVNLGSGRDVIAAGEIEVGGNGFQYNFMSGTYMRPLVETQPREYVSDLQDMVGKSFKESTGGRAVHVGNMPLKSFEPPSKKEWRVYCRFLSNGNTQQLKRLEALRSNQVCP